MDEKKKTHRKKKRRSPLPGLLLLLLILAGGAFLAWRLGFLDEYEILPPSPMVTPTPEPTPAPTPEPTPSPTPAPVFMGRGGYMSDVEGFFRPDEPLTLGEAAEILARAGQTVPYLGEADTPLTEALLRETIRIVAGDDLADAALTAVHGLGNETVTRAEAAVFFNRLFDLAPTETESAYFPDVDPGHWAWADIQTAAVSRRVWTGPGGRLEPGFYRRDGYLYSVDETGYFRRNQFVGSLLFGPDGRYTSGSRELDGYVADMLQSVDTGGMSREDLLYAAYTYVRDTFTYLTRHYYKIGDVGWQLEEALTMYSTGRGNCYCYAAAFWAAARQLGYDAKIVSGTYGDTRAPHGWVEIWQDGVRYTYDVEIEMVSLRPNHRWQNLYAMDDRARMAHQYIESEITDDLVSRETNSGLLPQ